MAPQGLPGRITIHLATLQWAPISPFNVGSGRWLGTSLLAYSELSSVTSIFWIVTVNNSLTSSSLQLAAEYLIPNSAEFWLI